MRWNWVVALAVCAALFQLVVPAAIAEPTSTAQEGWRALEPGLDLGQFKAPIASIAGDGAISVVRIEPARFEFDLLSAGALKLPQSLTIDAWMKQHGLAAAINAGMFEPGGRTTGYSRIGDAVLNPKRKTAYEAYLALDPDDPKLPAATILDPECDDVKALETHYRVILQSIRMIDCKGVNRWQKSARAWSTAALAIDDQGRVLMIHARSPWDVHDFIEILLKLPLGIRRAMYLEGGPEASLSLEGGGVSMLRIGSWETRFNENDANAAPWPLPNVIGVKRPDRKEP
jgi:hypothetical protein